MRRSLCLCPASDRAAAEALAAAAAAPAPAAPRAAVLLKLLRLARPAADRTAAAFSCTQNTCAQVHTTTHNYTHATTTTTTTGYRVAIVDPQPLGIWPNNYGVWVDEFQAMGLEDCLEVIWPKAKVWLDNDDLKDKFLDRPYGRVDRPRLKRKLLERCVAAGARAAAAFSFAGEGRACGGG